MKQEISERLGTDSLGKLLLRLSVPVMIAQVINVLYNIVDRIFIGQIPGVGAIALIGVGVTFPMIPLILILPRVDGLGITGIFLAQPIADFIAITTTVIVFAVQIRKIIPKENKTEKNPLI